MLSVSIALTGKHTTNNFLKTNNNNRRLIMEAKHSKDELFTSKEVIDALQSGQNGDKLLLTHLLEKKTRYDTTQQEWVCYDGQHWKLTPYANVYHDAKAVALVYENEINNQEGKCRKVKMAQERIKTAKRNIKELKKRIRALHSFSRKRKIITLAKATYPNGLGITGETQWQIPPEWLPCENTILFLDTLKSRNGKPEDYINKFAPTNWNPQADCQRWEKFMDEIFDGDQKMVSYMQRVLGYALSGTCKEHVFFILHGKNGFNGKSIMLETIKDVLGPLAQKVNSELFTGSSTKAGPDPELLSLREKRIAWANELSGNKALNGACIKEYTGGDTLVGRYPYSNDMIEFQPKHTIFMLTNSKPKIRGNDLVAWKRIHTIDFALSFVDDPKYKHERKVDTQLRKKLQKEAEGILAWMVRGYQEYQRIGLKPPEKVLNDSSERKSDATT